MSSRLPFRRLRHELMLPLARSVRLIARLVPRPAIWGFSLIVGRVLAGLPLKANRVIRRNSALAFPDGSGLVRPARVYATILAGVLDFLHLSGAPDEEFRRTVEVRGNDVMSRVLSRGKGLVVFTAHYSAWELIPRAIRMLGHRTAVVSRKLSEPGTSGFLEELRRAPGVAVLDRATGGRRLLAELHANAAVGVLIDVDTKGVDSCFVDFFGVPARTPVGASRLCVRLGIPALTLHISRLDSGRYLLEIDEPLETGSVGPEEAALELTRQATRRIESWIRSDSEQWAWFHRRWCRKPTRPAESRREGD